ncbi:MAG: acetylglutamate kinase, partial [Candidatus Nanopelagicaceae bacterium]
VGEISKIDISIINTFFEQGLTPVISPICVTEDGIGINMNADLVAGAIGGALKAEVVMFSTDVSGIYRNWPDEASLINSISVDELVSIASGFEGGMLPKANAAINAIHSGAKSVRIFDGRTIANLTAAHSGEIGTLVIA